jgi:hypothetical protein
MGVIAPLCSKRKRAFTTTVTCSFPFARHSTVAAAMRPMGTTVTGQKPTIGRP